VSAPFRIMKGAFIYGRFFISSGFWFSPGTSRNEVSSEEWSALLPTASAVDGPTD